MLAEIGDLQLNRAKPVPCRNVIADPAAMSCGSFRRWAAALVAIAWAGNAAGQEVRVLSDSKVPEAPGVVHFVASKGEAFTIGQVVATDRSQAGNTVVVEKIYGELCTTPCAVEMPVGWHEFHVAYKDREWTVKGEVKSTEQSLVFRRYRPGVGIGAMLASLALVTIPVTAPIWLWSNPFRAKWVEGAPG